MNKSADSVLRPISSHGDQLTGLGAGEVKFRSTTDKSDISIVLYYYRCNAPVVFDAEHFHSSSENKDIAGKRKAAAAP